MEGAEVLLRVTVALPVVELTVADPILTPVLLNTSTVPLVNLPATGVTSTVALSVELPPHAARNAAVDSASTFTSLLIMFQLQKLPIGLTYLSSSDSSLPYFNLLLHPLAEFNILLMCLLCKDLLKQAEFKLGP